MGDYCEQCKAYRIVKHGLCKRCRMLGFGLEQAQVAEASA